MQRSRKFCENQIICKEDIRKGTYTCMGHLAEGRALQCPFNEKEIKLVDKYENGDYRFIIQKIPRPGADGVCMDFEITPEVKSDLIKKVAED